MLIGLRYAGRAGWRQHHTRLALAAVALATALVLADSARAGNVAVRGYSFTPLAFLGDSAPGGGTFTFDFEPTAINDRGEVAFTADVTTGGEGVFVAHGGRIEQLTRSGLAAPGGGTMSDQGELGRLGLDDGGDVAVPFFLAPFAAPCTFQSGLYRSSHSTGTLTPVAVPGMAAPGGGTFGGVFYNPAMDNRGDIVFTGLVTGTDIDPSTPPGCDGIANALFLSSKDGTLTSIVRPGDPAPGGGVFDDAMNGSINDAGDIAFGAHVAGEPCVPISPFACGESVYLRSGLTGTLRSIAHEGDASPCGGQPYQLAFGALVDSSDDVAFIGAVGPSDGVFLYANGAVTPVACPGDAMPGGGTMFSAGVTDASYGLNQTGTVAFAATLNSDVNGDGINDSGVYVSSHGSLRLVARTGTVLPGIGTIALLGYPFDVPVDTGGLVNDRGQVLLYATLVDGRGVLLLATPTS
jgi:hypothetical protein